MDVEELIDEFPWWCTYCYYLERFFKNCTSDMSYSSRSCNSFWFSRSLESLDCWSSISDCCLLRDF